MKFSPAGIYLYFHIVVDELPDRKLREVIPATFPVFQHITVFIDSIVVAGGDQGLLNMYFSDWAHTDITKHLPFIYNVVSQAFYSYLPAFKQ